MNRRNYQRELDEILRNIEDGQAVPRLLLHSCCAPCSSYVLEYLSEYFHITDFFYNPNISPEKEYRHRVEEMKRLIQELPMKHPVDFVEGPYEPARYYDEVKGLEEEPEGGARCEVCFRMRLEEAAKIAAEGGFDYFTTTLTISPMKDPVLLNTIGEEMGERYGVKYLDSEFRKRNGYKRSIELSREYDLYRQDFCGCIFSKQEAERRREKEKEKEKQ